ncbi:SDR family oxidoreductase [Capnocytophaga canimorsus]|uniref:Peroxisomal trans-2-enoyl-CoA reductase n=1 Tax=Capnocytophaga canimorsus (strain 5) TaxID=860228 RepID=F9YSC7_CAPCC|nr:SDR family oxidoreductase [Capnocytophaga canimorsus]AEK23852.1 2,4-dienoyl-CoA reductase [NADPH] [Capnocytophaga canimorsus Cc5]
MMPSAGMLQKETLKGKTIVVTAGGDGLGLSMSRYFLKLGASVVITSRNFKKLYIAAAQLTKETDGHCLPLACDIRDYHQVEVMLKKSIEKLGKVDVLVNNAATNIFFPTEKLCFSTFDNIIDTTLKGSKNCTLAFGKHWINSRQTNASVLNMISTYALTGSAYVTASAMAKAGVLAMTRSLAVEWAKYGIRSNAIALGAFSSEDALRQFIPKELSEKFDATEKIPLRRMATHQELCDLTAFMISDYASFLNGEVITIDGGAWLQGAGQFNAMENIPPQIWERLGDSSSENKV